MLATTAHCVRALRQRRAFERACSLTLPHGAGNCPTGDDPLTTIVPETGLPQVRGVLAAASARILRTQIIHAPRLPLAAGQRGAGV